jgi:uncharacterized membrane protein YfcA
MAFSWGQEALAVLSGGAVGFSLGLIGGGGSILAVPLLLYVVGIGDPHVAIGTSALSVAANAFANLLGHWRAGNVKWPCAATFALAGIVGAAIGSTIGKLVDGQQLLFLFALAMIVVGVAMLRPRAAAGNPDVRMTAWIAVRLIAIGLVVGAVSGFFGIGGGFMIVPGLMLASGMPILKRHRLGAVFSRQLRSDHCHQLRAIGLDRVGDRAALHRRRRSWRLSWHACRDEFGREPAQAKLCLCGDHFRCRDLHAGAHRNSSVALNLMRSGT